MLNVSLSGSTTGWLARAAAAGLAPALVLVLVPALVLTPAASARSSAVQTEPPVPAPAPAAAPAGLSDVVREARATLERGDAQAQALQDAAAVLLAAADLDGLRAALSGSAERSALAALAVLAAPGAALPVPLLPDLLEVGARGSSAGLRAAAIEGLARLANARDDVASPLVGWLTDPSMDAGRRQAVIAALGGSGRLEVVDNLILALDGDLAPTAREALERVTGRDLGVSATAADWRAWWQDHRTLSRVELLELAVRQRDELHDRAMAAKDEEIIRERLASMDTIERMLRGLGDPFPEVRREAAVRLANHSSKEQAAACVPVILSWLGHAAQVEAPAGVAETAPTTSPAISPATSPTTSAAPPTRETNPDVRAQMVRTLGALGRTRDDVRKALLDELRSDWPAVGGAAAEGLELLRDQPEIVAPLLDYLARVDGEENAVAVLKAVALNRPAGIIPRLQPLLEPRQPARVRSAAVSVLLASENLSLALDRLDQLIVVEDALEVSFQMAASLGEAARRLAADAPERQRIVSLLGTLLEHSEPAVRAEAAAALGRSGAMTAIGLLDRRALAEIEPPVVEQLVEALGALHLPEGIPIIGRIVMAQAAEGRARIEDLARAALTQIGEGRAAAEWVDIGDRLTKAGAHALAAWAFRETVNRFEAQPEQREVVQAARGQLASALVNAELYPEAATLLEALEKEQATLPSLPDRLDLMARVAEAQGRWSDAANVLERRLALLPEGEVQRTATLRLFVTALERADRNREALPHLRALVSQATDDNTLLFDLARVEEVLKQYLEAYTDLQRLSERLPADDTLLRPHVVEALERVKKMLGALPAKAEGEPGAPPSEPGAPPKPEPAPDGGVGPADGAAEPPEAPSAGSSPRIPMFGGASVAGAASLDA